MTDPLDFSPASGLRNGRVGIVDIGSNSIRLVVYDQHKRAPVSIYNEKVMCALGKGLATSGLLNPEGVELARAALRRFLAMGRNMGVVSLYVMATAAVRDARDGGAFAKYLEDAYAIDVDVISGKKEARLGAYGVCSSMHAPCGVTGDLGGGSMEMVWLDNGRITDQATLKIGVLRLLDETRGNPEKLQKIIHKRLDEIAWLDSRKTPNFYAIGGSFRALAKIHMAIHHYPLRILHEYTVSAKDFLAFAHDVAGMTPERVEKLPGSASKRAQAIPAAAMILCRVIETACPGQIVFSASGIREGYLYEKLSPYIREQDVLMASCTEFAIKGGRAPAYAQELFVWMFPLFERESEEERRLRLAFCLLCDIALHIHPEYRAEWAFQRVLYSALTGLTHRERVKLALALYHRYQFPLKDTWPALSLITERDQRWSLLAGTCANLAYHLTGSVPGNLHKTALVFEKNAVRLQLGESVHDLAGEAIRKRVDGVREAYEKFRDCPSGR